jgi:hypothetical protein
MRTNLDKWQDYVKDKNIGKTTEQRCFGRTMYRFTKSLTGEGASFDGDIFVTVLD